LQVTISSLSGEWFPAFGAGSAAGIFNFGSRPFAYTPPSNHVSLCTQNLPDPTIADGSTAFDTKLYTGNGTTQTISGLEYSPDLVWIKRRSGSAIHVLNDTVRDAGQQLSSNSSDAEITNTNNFAAFTSDGFTVGSGSGTNASSETHVAWTWDGGSSTVSNTDGSITSQVRANLSAGFSVCTYTGLSGNQSFGHGLNDAPKFIAIKNRSSSANWFVMVDIGTTYYKYGHLNTTAAFADATAQPVSSTTVTLGNNNAWFGANGDNYVAYCWAPVEGYSAFGSYTGNGSSDGPFVYTGFRPKFILIKNADIGSAGYDWYIYDTERDPYNVSDRYLMPNLTTAELSYAAFDLLSNGFKLRQTGASVNGSGNNHVFACFAEHPFKTSRAR
jgi:hypothetical protein